MRFWEAGGCFVLWCECECECVWYRFAFTTVRRGREGDGDEMGELGRGREKKVIVILGHICAFSSFFLFLLLPAF